MQVIVDERADSRRREALTKIVHGEETDEGATHWWVYRSMSDTLHETLVKPIEFDVDLDARAARVAISGVLESVGRPIVSPATGQQHRVRSTSRMGSSSRTPRSAVRRRRPPLRSVSILATPTASSIASGIPAKVSLTLSRASAWSLPASFVAIAG
jgi:hypothetical protein